MASAFNSGNRQRNEGQSSPPKMFHAVVDADYDGLAKLFAENARDTVVSYISMKSRWARQDESMGKAEEKTDDFMQRSPQRLARSLSDPKELIVIDSCDYLISPETKNKHETEKSHRCRTTVTAAQSKDLYRLVWEASSTLADSRPPSNLCIYDRSGATSPPMGHENDPPIFDGSVANATPAPHGGVGASGGCGTILHLACAMNRPLMLAFFLVMGADGRASHTAFRRLMVHEAACNGSIDCLTLLLEMGHKHAKEIEDRKESCLVNNNSDQCGVPFLPDEMEISSLTPPPRLAARTPSALPLGLRHFGRATRTVRTVVGVNEKDKARHSAFMPILRQFKSLAKSVNDGNMSELQAARSLLTHASILETTRAALIRSCFFRNDTLYASHSFLRPFGCADGHGNTPLHWASFKNETECVALLLHYNADPNARAHPSGWTPLHDAAYSNSPACIELLTNKGAQIDAKANSGATPLCFAAQEDAFEAAQLLLERGADLASRCAGPPPDNGAQYHYQLPNHPHSRFSGYTPLHYCAHYNAQRASQVLLSHSKAKMAMEVPDLSGRLPIHVAVARGSSDVLRALLHAGARVDIPPNGSPTSVARQSPPTPINFGLLPSANNRQQAVAAEPGSPSRSSSATNTSPVTSPLLRSMIPSQPIRSSKPWNCLSQQAIDECKELILKSEQSWSPDHHLLFTPNDRKAVMELLRVGKRLEQNGTGIFIDLWPTILGFCGRGWFETDERKLVFVESDDNAESPGDNDGAATNEENDQIQLDGNNYLALPNLED